MITNSAMIDSSDRPESSLALRMARTPRATRRLSRWVLIALLATPFVLMFVPWTQTVHGTGKAIAFNPVQRPQFIVSPIEGRIKKWYVVEGERVRAGQRIVEMVDNDPNLELRLLDEERAILDRLRAAEGRVRDIEARIRNLENSRTLAIQIQENILRQEQARLQGFEQEQLEAQAAVDAAEPNLKRQKELFESKLGGLASKRDLELAEQALTTARAKQKQAEARVTAGRATANASADSLKKVDADTLAMINLENASKRSAEADVASIRRDKAQIETRIARQRAQYVDAPADGTVYRLLANAEQGGVLVRPGERLASIVPDIKETSKTGSAGDAPNGTAWISSISPNLLATLTSLTALSKPDGAHPPLTEKSYPGIVAEILIDGNDLPLIRIEDPVRLQFEGWPAVQFVGWPSVAVGTFGGRVYLVDPTTTDEGKFRILVEPDPNEPPWPNQQYLRQGVRTQGWVLLNRVTLGWELWRQINGFPPVRSMSEPKSTQALGPVKLKDKK